MTSVKANRGKLNVLDLYAGSGRSIEPFRSWRRVGGVYLADVNQYAADVYLHNRVTAAYKVCDLRKTSPADLVSFAGGRVDILLGCPPCQGFSDCGSKSPRDPRNKHVTRYHEIVRDLRPLAFAMENVPLVVTSKRFKQFLVAIESLGYVWTASIVNAAVWGSCQSRQRLILVAAQKQLGVQPKIPKPTHGGSRRYFSYATHTFCKLKADLVGMLGRTPATQRTENRLPTSGCLELGETPIPTVEEVIGDLPRIFTPKAERLNHKLWKHSRQTLRRMASVAEGRRWNGGSDHFSQAYGRLHRKGLARTITSFFSNAGSGRFWHPTENRALTLREAARIQGFPDDHTFLGRDRENCALVGNALDKTLADLTFRIIRESME